MPTHKTDCTVKPEWRDRITEAARLLYEEDDYGLINELDADEGWVRIGSGSSRDVYEVPPPAQEGSCQTPMEEAPCVVKFATPPHRGHHHRHIADGVAQNRSEVKQYQSFPPALTEGEGDTPPVVMPVSDWESNYMWTSAPMADPDGGSGVQVRQRLRDHGWRCDDIYHDNIGSVDGWSVLIDYGLDCRENRFEEMLAGVVYSGIRLKGVQTITGSASFDAGRVDFIPPSSTMGDAGPPMAESFVLTAEDSARGGVIEMEFVFGSWHDDKHYVPTMTDLRDDLQSFVEDVIIDRIGTREFADLGVDVFKWDRDGLVNLSVEIDTFGMTTIDPWVVDKVYGDIIDFMAEEAPGEPARSEAQMSIGSALERARDLHHAGATASDIIEDLTN